MLDLHDALRPIIEQPTSAPPPVEHLAGRSRRRRTRRRAAGVAVAVATLAVPLWASRGDPPATTTRASDDSVAEPPSPGGSDAPRAPSTTAAPTPPFGATAPWAAAPLPQAEVPAFVAAWNSDPAAAAECPLLAPDDLGEGRGATPRMTTRGQPGRWGVEFDLPGSPGEPEDQALPTPDAGRSTFTVYAVVMPPIPPGMAEQLGIDSVDDLVTQRPHVHTWADGSAAGWGGAIVVDEPGSGLATSETVPGEPPEPVVADAAYVRLPGAGSPCLYSVSTYLGEDHLFHLIDHLRRVESAP
jgi:hypothetical protein